MVQIWRQQVKENTPLTPIIPLVIYHGERPWTAPVNFLSLLDAPEALRPYTPDFHYRLSDFSHLSDEEIRGEIWLRVSRSVLRAIFNPHLRQELESLIRLTFELRHQRTGLEYIHTILYYLSRATERVKREDLQQVLLRQEAQGEQTMTTIAQEFIQEGIEEGQIQTLQENILDLLNIRFGLASAEVTQQVTAVTDSDTLRQLHREAAMAPSVAVFLQTLANLS